MSKEQRKTPGPMRIYVFKKPDEMDTMGSLVYTGSPGETGESAIRGAVKTGGYGKYTVITGRQVEVDYKEEKRDVFAFSKEQ